MLKRRTIVLVGLAATLGFAVAPGASGAESEAVGSVLLSDTEGFGGTEILVPESQIPTECSAVPEQITSVRAADNQTSLQGTSVSFYPDADCESIPVTLAPGQSNGDIFDPAGATRWQRTP